MYYVTGGMSSNTAEVSNDNSLHVAGDVSTHRTRIKYCICVETNNYQGTLIASMESEAASSPSSGRFNKIQLEFNLEIISGISLIKFSDLIILY